MPFSGGKTMEKRFAVVYGSSVTGMFADGAVFPRDIDIMTNMDKRLVRTMAMRWFRQAYPYYPEDKEIKIDFHDPEVKEGTVEVPMLQITGVSPKKEYHILYADDGMKVKAYIRENGVASLLRIYGNVPEVFAEKIRDYPEGMSIMPEGVFYYNDRPEMDKYYSGLQATRNACVKFNIKLIKKYKIKLIKKFNVIFPENVIVLLHFLEFIFCIIFCFQFLLIYPLNDKIGL